MATRREKVILELQDNFSSEMARAAAATALLDKNLKALDGSAVKSQRSVSALGQNDGLPALSRNSVVADKSINQLTGRLALFVKTAAAIGPAVVPIGAAAVPALSGMATQLGLTVAAAGTAVLAFQGIGEGLETLNAYQLEPTAENFQKMQMALEKVGPAGAEFVRFLDSVAPQFEKLQMTAREGLFPGVEDGITSLLGLLPQMDRIVSNVAEAMGQLASEAGAGLSGEGFTAFFNYLESNAKPILIEMGRTIGNFAEGLGNMLVGFGPLSADFSGGLLDMSRAFNEWTQNLDNNQGFQEFLSYVQESAPKVLDLLGSFVNVFVQVAQAMAPVGDVIVPALTQLLDVVAKIADSPLGTVFLGAAAGMSAYSLAARGATAASAKLGMAGMTSLQKFDALAARGPQIAAGIGMVGLAMTDLDDKLGLSNTAMLTLAGSMAGPWGAAAGAAVGFTMDLASGNDELATAIERANRAAESNSLAQQESALRGLRAEMEALNQAGESGNFWSLDIGKNIDFFKAKYAEATGATDDFRTAQRELEQSMSGGAALGSLLVGPLGMTEAAFEAATASAEDFSAAVAQAMGILDRRAALRNFSDSVRSFNDQMKEAPANLRRGTAAFDEAQDGLDAIGRNALTAAEHLRGMERVNFLSRARKDFVGAARDMGLPIRAAENLADRLGLLNKTVAKPKIDADTKGADQKIEATRRKGKDFGNSKWEALLGVNDADAKNGISTSKKAGQDFGGNKWEAILGVNESGVYSGVASANAALNSIAGRTVTTFINTVRNVVPGGSSAYGNIFEAYANGDIRDRHQPELYRAPVTRIWGEPETGGEAYIPLRDDSRRPRAKSILEETASILGGQVAWYARGGSQGGNASGGPKDNSAPGVGNDLRDAGRGAKELKQRLREATKELERETKSRERLRGWADELRSSVAGSFDNDIFGSGLSGLKLQLEADRNDARAMKAALAAAKKKGLDGGLFSELAASGDLATAQQIASMGRGGISQLEQLFQQTNQAQSGLASFAVNTQFGKELRESNRERKHLIRVVNKLEDRLKDLDKKVEDGARRGIGDRDRKTSQRSRARA